MTQDHEQKPVLVPVVDKHPLKELPADDDDEVVDLDRDLEEQAEVGDAIEKPKTQE